MVSLAEREALAPRALPILLSRTDATTANRGATLATVGRRPPSHWLSLSPREPGASAWDP